MTNLINIERGLSGSEREGITDAFETADGMAVAFSTGSANSLVRLGLAEVPPGHFWPILNSNGLALRRHLLENPK
jgi:hypothetical protein